MTEITQNERSFIQTMKKSPDHERHGLKLLLERKRDCLDRFLGVLKNEGFFEPEKNPAPVPMDDDGRVHVPYWPPLDYLTACARQAADQKNDVLGAKVMDIVRKVSDGTDGKIRDNFQTARKFAEIIGLLPTSVVRVADVDLVERWIGTTFSYLHVVHALDEGAIGNFLASDVSEDWIKAVGIVRHCTAVRWVAVYGDIRKPAPVVDDLSLSRLLDRHASDLAHKVPSESAALLEERIQEVFDSARRERSDALRPAVEEHDQNRDGAPLENGLVAALRDVLLIWCDVDSVAAPNRVEKLLRSDVEMLRRIGIHVLNRRWSSLRGLYSTVIAPELFQEGHIHELYGLLRERFETFSGEEKKRTTDAICRIPGLEGEDSKKQRQFMQLRWLGALSSAKYAPADKKMSKLLSAGVTVSDHPDFNVYLEVTSERQGNGPYQVRELMAFAEDGSLVERLNTFTPTDDPHGFAVGELVGVLAQAVDTAPETFCEMLPKFVDLSRPYQSGIINGFQAFWKKSRAQQTTFDWDRGWREIVRFLDAVMSSVQFWNNGDGTPQFHARDSLVAAMVDFFEMGMGDDAHACPEPVLPCTLDLIRRVLDEMDSTGGARHPEPMMHAINATRGRAIEALFGNALRLCRLSDKRCASHDDVWREVQPVFDAELRKCRHGNWMFSTLAGAHLVNLDYMSAAWLRENVGAIFPVAAESNFNCAVAGLAYSKFTRSIYVLLKEAGVIERALDLDLRGPDTRRRLIERILAAYLWKEERRDSLRMRYSFEHDAVQDLLDAAHFLWMIRREALSSEQRVLIVDYWDDCVRWASQRSNPPSDLLDALGRLAWAMETIDDRNVDLLLASAPHMGRHFSSEVLLEQLARFVGPSPAAVGKVLKALVAAGVSVYDRDRDLLEKLILALNEGGQREAALDCCNKLIAQPGMDELYRRLTAPVPASAA